MIEAHVAIQATVLEKVVTRFQAVERVKAKSLFPFGTHVGYAVPAMQLRSA
jgi:hypothetical protein